MGTGYTRNDTLNNIADGNIINASDLDGEFNVVESAFNESTGHTHDGTAAEGAPVTVLGPVQDFIASATEIKPKTTNTLDIGTNSLQFKDMYLEGTAYLDDIQAVGAVDITGDLDVDNININGNTIISTDTNGDINLSPNGTGTVVINTDLDVDNININGNTISSTDTNGNITLAPNGTGVVALSSTDLTFGDNDKAIFGAGSDLQIYHDGTSSIIADAGSGNLQIRANDFQLLNAANTQNIIRGYDATGAVSLHYGGAEKLATSSSGVYVTGTISSNKGSAGTLATFTDGVNSNFVVETASLLTTIGNGGGSAALALKANNTEAMRIDSSGNVGIGTSSPNSYAGYSALTLDHPTNGGIIDIERNGTLIGEMFSTDANTFTLAAVGAKAFTVYTNVTERMRINSSGNVGIANSSPTSKLTIGSSSIAAGTGLFQQIQTAGNNMYVGIGSNNSAYIQANGEFRIATGGYADKVIVDSSGNVGIGTSSPNEKVTINGSFRAASQDWQMQILNPDTAAANKGGGIAFGGSYTGTTQTYFSNILGAKENGTAGNLAGYLSFYTRLSGEAYTAERMRITSAGNVGIGVTSPSSKLQIQNDSSTAYDPASAAFNTILGIKNNTSGASNNAIMAFTTESNGEWYIGGVQNSGNTAADFVFASRDSGARSERLRITSAGKVGIGSFSGLTNILRVASDNPTAYFNAQLELYSDAGNIMQSFHAGGSSVVTLKHVRGVDGIEVRDLNGTTYKEIRASAFTVNSDYRLKENIVPLENATERLKQIPVHRFNFKSIEETGEGFGDATVDGFLAHEVQTVVPEAISGTHNGMRDEEYEVTPAVLDEDGNEVTPAVMGTRSVPDYQGIDQSKLVPLLVKTIQELEARITALEASNG
jgi:hypothetical protein